MRTRLLIPTLVLGISLLGAASAQGGVLQSATWNGEFFGNSYSLVTGNGLQAMGVASPASAAVGLTVTQTNTGVPCPTNLGLGTGTCFAPNLNVVDPTQLLPLFLSQTLGGSQQIGIAGQGAMVVADSGIPGNVDVAIVGVAPLFSVPLSIGADFTQVIQTTALGVIPVTVSVEAKGWQTAPTSIAQTAAGSPITPFTAAGSFALNNPGGDGTITLIAPTKLSVTLLGGPLQTSASATELVLQFEANESGERGGLGLAFGDLLN